jgi:hypothetical protein
MRPCGAREPPMSSTPPAYVSRIGPEHGPISGSYPVQTVDVFTDPRQAPIGTAEPRGRFFDRGERTVLFRLRIDGKELPASGSAIEGGSWRYGKRPTGSRGRATRAAAGQVILGDVKTSCHAVALS